MEPLLLEQLQLIKWLEFKPFQKMAPIGAIFVK